MCLPLKNYFLTRFALRDASSTPICSIRSDPESETETSNIIAEAEGENDRARLDALESRMSSLEQTMNTAFVTLLPKVEKILTRMTVEEETTSVVCTSTATGPSTLLFLMAERGDHEALLRLVREKDLDFSKNPQRNDCGDTPLHVAAKRGHMPAVVVLLGAGEDVNVLGPRLRTPLHYAVAENHPKVTVGLLQHGAKVDAKDADGVTPMGLAARCGNRTCMEILWRDGGVAPEESDFSTAAENGRWEVLKWMLEKEGMFIPMWSREEKDPLVVLACKAHQWGIVQRLLRKGASAINCKSDRESALLWASKAGKADVVQLLLRHGAASQYQQMRWALMATRSGNVVKAFVAVVPNLIRGKLGKFGLVCAGSYDRVGPLLAFLEAGVDVNSKDRDGVAVLSRAASYGNELSVKKLVENGADVNIRSNSGNTPLHVAASKGQAKCVRILLEAGALTSVENKKGEIPLDVARTSAVQRMLREKS